MAGPIGKIGFKVIGTAIAIPSGIVVKQVLKKSWARSRGEKPPGSPKAPGTDWLEALTWAAVSAAVITGGKIAATRATEATYRVLTGQQPPGHSADELARRREKRAVKGKA